MPFSLTRYALALMARWPASVLLFSVGCCLPTTTRRASASRCSRRATSSNAALAALSTRATIRLKLIELIWDASGGAGGGGGGGGACTVTLAVSEAVRFLSSETLQVTLTVPGAAPAVFKVAVLPVPLTVPAEAS